MSEVSRQQPVIDHPARLGWQPGGLTVASARVIEALRQRFTASGEDVDGLLQAVDLMAIQLDSYRLTHERDNVGRLQLGLIGRAMYERLAGRPDRFGEYIHWFGVVATRALLRRDHDYSFNSVALELAGRRQLGDWTATRQLDIAMRRIPGQLHALRADITAQRPEPARSNYQLHPLYDDELRHYGFQYAGVRRRQPLLDVQEGYCRPVRVYRQAVGLLVLGQLAPESRQSIVEAYESAGPEHGAENNTPAATMAGAVFERAVTDRTARAIIPIGTQYIMRVMAEEPEVSTG